MSSYVFTRQKVFPQIFFTEGAIRGYRPVCCTAFEGNSERNDCYLGPPSPPKKIHRLPRSGNTGHEEDPEKQNRQQGKGKKGEDRKCVYLVPDCPLFWGFKFHPQKKKVQIPNKTQGSTCWFQVYTVGKNGKAVAVCEASLLAIPNLQF